MLVLAAFIPMTALGQGAAVAAASSDTNAAASPRIVNIINFVRQCEPRIEWITEDVLYDTVVEQINSLKRHQLRGTFLLQYDALMNPRYQKLFKGLPPDQFEIGAWWEIPQPLVEKSGLKWRGRYPWDWHADVGFATGYSPEEREKLTDAYMADFQKIFGYYPKSVGSWFIDAHTLQYMHERYRIEASCNCKDQIGTDGYTLWGGYWNQGYYPSKKNAYMPAQNAANQIPVPIFRMLGSDPIHQYDSGLGSKRQRVISLEPVYTGGGGNAEWCRWYFDAFASGPAMSYGYTQTGQENSFAWKRMAKGFDIQMPLIARLRDQGKVSVETLAETGRWFKNRYPVTPPTSVTALNDHSEKNLKTVWFNSRFFRANLLWEQGTMRFRDIHLFDENLVSDYLTQRGTSNQCFYSTLPVVDGFNWSSLQTVAGLRLKRADGAEIKGGVPTVDDQTKGELRVRWPVDSPKGMVTVRFTEASFEISANLETRDGWFLELSHDPAAQLPFRRVEERKLSCVFRGHPYSVTAKRGSFVSETGSALRILPQANQVALDFSTGTAADARAGGKTNATVVASNAAPATATANKELKLPGLTINLEQRSVDIESSVCLHHGSLELVACTKDTKEHESIVVIAAKPIHVHAALLLLGAKPGNPAMRKVVGENNDRWIHIPPSGGPVDVYLVFEDETKKLVERPISDFIVSSKEQSEDPSGEAGKFPTHTFIFTGSVLIKGGSGPGKYLCDESGNVISISTFGDEVLSLPEVHSSENEALAWQVKGDALPAVGSKVILRLRPKIQPASPVNKAKPLNPDPVPPKVGP